MYNILDKNFSDKINKVRSCLEFYKNNSNQFGYTGDSRDLNEKIEIAKNALYYFKQYKKIDDLVDTLLPILDLIKSSRYGMRKNDALKIMNNVIKASDIISSIESKKEYLQNFKESDNDKINITLLENKVLDKYFKLKGTYDISECSEIIRLNYFGSYPKDMPKPVKLKKDDGFFYFHTKLDGVIPFFRVKVNNNKFDLYELNKEGYNIYESEGHKLMNLQEFIKSDLSAKEFLNQLV